MNVKITLAAIAVGGAMTLGGGIGYMVGEAVNHSVVSKNISRKVGNIVTDNKINDDMLKNPNIGQLSKESEFYENNHGIPLWKNEIIIALHSWDNKRLLDKFEKHKTSIIKTSEQETAMMELYKMLENPQKKSDSARFIQLIFTLLGICFVCFAVGSLGFASEE